MHFLYLILDALVILFPFLLSFDKKVAYYKDWSALVKSILCIATPFLIHDYFFTEMGVWGFEADFLCGIYLLNLPLEEVLFFVVVPYACVFIYQCCKAYFPDWNLFLFNRLIQSVLFIYAFSILIWGYGAWYSSMVSVISILLMFYIAIYRKDLEKLALAFTLSIIPFFMMNGILTGILTEKPIVWYNNLENVGFRWTTIPAEDVLYAYILIAGSILFFEKFKKA